MNRGKIIVDRRVARTPFGIGEALFERILAGLSIKEYDAIVYNGDSKINDFSIRLNGEYSIGVIGQPSGDNERALDYAIDIMREKGVTGVPVSRDRIIAQHLMEKDYVDRASSYIDESGKKVA